MVFMIPPTVIANFVIEYARTHDNFVPVDIISSLENSDIDGKEMMVNQITELYMERNHPKCDQKLLDNLQQVIKEEKERIFENDLLEQSLQNKSQLDQARILAEYNRRKVRKK